MKMTPKKMEKEEQALKTIETENEKIANEVKTKKKINYWN